MWNELYCRSEMRSISPFVLWRDIYIMRFFYPSPSFFYYIFKLFPGHIKTC